MPKLSAKSLLFFWSVSLAAPSGAQTVGVPVSYTTVLTGVGFALDVGVDTAGFRTTAVTGTAIIGKFKADSGELPLFGVSMTGAVVAAERQSHAGWSAAGRVSLINSFQVGVGYSRAGASARVLIPLSAAIPGITCVGAKRSFVLYGTPTWNFEHVNGPGVSAWRNSWSSLGVGALLQLRSGVGFQLMGEGPFSSGHVDAYRRLKVGVQLSFTRGSISRAATGGGYGCEIL